MEGMFRGCAGAFLPSYFLFSFCSSFCDSLLTLSFFPFFLPPNLYTEKGKQDLLYLYFHLSDLTTPSLFMELIAFLDLSL